MYAIGYGAVRFVIEYFREPDYGIGYIVKLGDPSAPTYRFGGVLNLSMGQVLCAIMIAGGALMLWLCSRVGEGRAGDSGLGGRGAEPGPAQAERARWSRKLRKMIK